VHVVLVYCCMQILLALQSMINICESELNSLYMAVNANISACLLHGPRYKHVCANVMGSDLSFNWITSARYLGVHLESSFTFKCTFVTNKLKFYQANWSHCVRRSSLCADKIHMLADFTLWNQCMSYECFGKALFRICSQ